MSDAPLLLKFTDAECCNVDLAGGKGASLATMTQKGLPVPPGFVVTSHAFANAVDADALRKSCVANDMDTARAIVREARTPEEQINQYTKDIDGLVAVRSSACAEDSEGASYAGQQETFLNVEGVDNINRRIVDCWLSFFADRAAFYRAEKGSMEDISIAVVVQQMVDSQKSGVLFSVDPVHGRKDRMVVEAAFGLGENVVDGEHTPDNYTLNKSGKIKRSRIIDKQVLNEAETTKLAEMAHILEDIHGCPQDIEWAFDAGGDLFMLQSRPITTL